MYELSSLSMTQAISGTRKKTNRKEIMEGENSIYLYDHFNNEEEALEALLVGNRAKEEGSSYIDTHIDYVVGEIIFTEEEIEMMKECVSFYFYT